MANVEHADTYYAALGEIGRLVAHTPNVPQLLQQACELVAHHTGSTATYIATIDGTPRPQVRLAALAGPSGSFSRRLPLSVHPDEPGGNGMVGRTYRERAPVASNDCLNDPQLAHARDAVASWGLRAAAGVPIFIASRVRAVLVTAACQKDHYSPSLVALLERIAEALATGMDRAEERQHRLHYETLYDVQSKVNALIARDPEPHELFEQTCRIVPKVSPALNAYVATADPGTETLRIIACAGERLTPEISRRLMNARISTRAEGPNGDWVASRTFRERHAIVEGSIDTNADTSPRGQVFREAGTRSVMGIPITVNEALIGTLVLASSEPGYFEPTLIHVGEQIGDSLGIALKAHEQRTSLRRMALTDALTGLPNRTLYEDRLRMAMAQIDRNGGQVAVALIDLDDFKDVNTRFGHAAGDEVLRQVATRLSTPLRESDTLARLGGDEFAALLPMRDASLSGDSALSRILGALDEPFTVDTEQVAMHASIGVAIYPRDGRDPEDLLRRADLALYRVKSAGGNRWGMFERSLEEQLWTRHRLRERFVQALATGEIIFHYQPVVELSTGRVVGAEALARWRDSEHRLLPPAEWIETVEDSPALIRALGQHALHSGMKQLQAWHAAGKALSLSVNIGVRHLLTEPFLDDLGSAVAIAPDLAPQLILEITERALIDDFSKVTAVLAACRQLGVQVALDDFGTGQASLTYLLKLPADRLKIDNSFVLQILSDFRAFSIVVAAARLARMLGMKVIAEGLETGEHGLRLLQMGCQYAQGFGIAKPMSADAFETWSRTWQPPESWRMNPERPLPPEFIVLLASTVLHRARYAAMLGMTGETSRGDEAAAPEVWSSYCPINVETPEAHRQSSEHGLAALHREVHRLERECLDRIAKSGQLPQELLTQIHRLLQKYESGVNEILSG